MHWDFFDRIYCISTEERPDRRRDASAQFRTVGLESRVAFVIFTRHSADPEQGIYTSHMHCIHAALASGSRRILIFEDDVLFDRFSPEALDHSVSFMSTHADWDLFFFGCFVRRSRPTEYRSVLRIRYQCMTHAYVLNRPFAERIVTYPWQGIAMDDFLRAHQGNAYAVYPMFAFQSESPSDNRRYARLYRIAALLGKRRCLQARNEFFHRNKRLIVATHVAVMLVLAIVLFIVLAAGGWSGSP